MERSESELCRQELSWHVRMHKLYCIYLCRQELSWHVRMHKLRWPGGNYEGINVRAEEHKWGTRRKQNEGAMVCTKINHSSCPCHDISTARAVL